MVNIVIPATIFFGIYPFYTRSVIVMTNRAMRYDHMAIVPVDPTEIEKRRQPDTGAPVKSKMTAVVYRMVPVNRRNRMPPVTVDHTRVVVRDINHFPATRLNHDNFFITLYGLVFVIG